VIPLLIKSISAPARKPKPAAKPADPAPTTATPEHAGKYAGLLALLADHNPESKFGPDAVEPGHHVTFKAGTFVGSGKVTAAGKHGVTVEDDDARAHRVHWHEITGHVAGESKGKKSGGDAQK
jgi:hypothetical protein